MSAMVESTVNYLADMAERPFFYVSEPPAGMPRRNTTPDRRCVAIRDARGLASTSLDEAGFLLAAHETSVTNLYDATAVRERYYPEMEELVARITGAARVVAFDHNVRCAPMAERHENNAQPPVRFAHNDYTECSAPQRVRDLFPRDEAAGLLRNRFAVINVWKPIRIRVEEWPLAVCDARTIGAGDLVPTDLRYRDRAGEIYSLRFNPEHRWFYYSHMRPDETMLLKCFDSDGGRARFTAHTAFDDPTSPADAPARESIEVRTLAFFAPGPGRNAAER